MPERWSYFLLYLRPDQCLGTFLTRCRCVCLPRNASSRDELGETLATLVFAQRAMSVSMDAHITVVPDLDARCQDLQRQLDNQSDRLTRMTLMKAAAEEELQIAQDQLAQLHEEKNATDARLRTVVEAYDRILKVMLQTLAVRLRRSIHYVSILSACKSKAILQSRGVTALAALPSTVECGNT